MSERDADAFCQWLSKETETYRLPTAAEWEYACRAGTQTLYSCGDDPDALDQHGNVADAALRSDFPARSCASVLTTWANTTATATPSPRQWGACRPNAWGLYDMHGNVWEWCRDRFHDRYYEDLAKQLRDHAQRG